MMKREDDQELWDLLGSVRAPELTPFFARNVLRQIRQEKTWRENLFARFKAGSLIPASAVALAVITVSFSMRVLPPVLPDSPDNPPALVASIDPQDYDAVDDLDDLLTPDDGLWNDNDTSSL